MERVHPVIAHPTSRRIIPEHIEIVVRSMTKPERRDHLRRAGWTSWTGRGLEEWFHPTRGAPGGDEGMYSLAAAVRIAILEDGTP